MILIQQGFVCVEMNFADLSLRGLPLPTLEMKRSNNVVPQLTSLLLYIISWSAASVDPHEDFLSCLVSHSSDPGAISRVISTPNSESYKSILNTTIQNLRFTLPNTPKPRVIITPEKDSQIQRAIYCSKKHGLQVRILSGGHDFEGISYVSRVPYFVLNMFNYRSITIDAKSQTAWVGAGATVGETYYKIVQTNSSLAFPAAYFPTVGIGGHVSGGGYGPLLRRFGLAADNVLDARIIDANGKILNRKSMGEDFFWAIRGGTGASFAIILEYKFKLVEVSKELTAFKLRRTLEQGATKLLHKWQYVAPKFPENLVIQLSVTTIQSNQTGKSTVEVTFNALFEGEADRLVGIMEEQFPELGLGEKDCIKSTRWVDFIAYFLGLPIETTDRILKSRVPSFPKSYFKSKSDFFQQPIPEEGLERIWDVLFQIDPPAVQMAWTPLGARMAEIPESETPFPHRAGNLFLVYQKILWYESDPNRIQERFASMRKLHGVMGQYVDTNPRAAYANHKDLDLGVNNVGKTSVEQARIWGASYFKNNFDRLVKVKTEVDPDDYFKNEQSIPPASSCYPS